ncbi:MAG: phage portal protein [Christensenellaceae bacterium]
MELFGRRKIYTSLEPTVENIPTILTTAFPIHLRNANEIAWLIDYTKGKQDILTREKEIRSDINNKVVINNAFSIIRTFEGYFLGEPIQYVARKCNAQTVKYIQQLNDFMAYEDKHYIDKEIYNKVSICGVGYKGTFRNSDLNVIDDIPFEQTCLDPQVTFEVLSTNLGNPTALTCSYFKTSEIVDKKEKTFLNLLVYTDIFQCRYKVEESETITVLPENIVPYEVGGEMLIAINHDYGGNPITSYYSNFYLMGKFEMAISIMDAINRLESNSLDDIEQVVQSILVFFGIDKEQQDDVQSGARAGALIMFSGVQGINQDVKYVNPTLDSTSVNLLRESLKEQLKDIVGIPDRKTRGGGGGDTMGAVKLRDGWADIEVVARNDESFWSKGEKKSLKIVLKISHDNGKLKNLKLTDIDVKFSRNKNDDMQTKTQAMATMYNMKMPLLEIIKFAGITNDATEFANSWQQNIDSEEQKETQKAEQMANQQKAETAIKTDTNAETQV